MTPTPEELAEAIDQILVPAYTQASLRLSQVGIDLEPQIMLHGVSEAVLTALSRSCGPRLEPRGMARIVARKSGQHFGVVNLTGTARGPRVFGDIVPTEDELREALAEDVRIVTR